jgi:hypothetical protein
MHKRIVRAALVVAAMLIGWTWETSDGASQAHAQRPFYVAPQYDLFYNYYVGPPGVPAPMYVAPRPVPPFVGQTYITYQPLLPNEFLYKHHRTYRRYDGCIIPVNTTHVRWW